MIRIVDTFSPLISDTSHFSTEASRFIGLVGLGYWGKNILRNLYQLNALHSACDINPSALSEHNKNFPGVNFTDSYDKLLKNPEIKALVISTPAATHYELAEKAIEAGKDVFIEKPLALTVKEGEKLVELAEEANRILMVGHILQYHPAVLRIKELVSSGELGKIQYIYSNRLNIGKLRTEENILWSFAPHDISVILMLLEEVPIHIYAFGGDYLNSGVYDTTITTLEFKNGVKGHIFVNWLHPYKEQKLIVIGTKAMAVFDDMSKEKLFLYPHTISWKDGKIPVAHKADFEVISIEKGEPLQLEMIHFINCVQNRKKPRTDGHEGLRVLRILNAAEIILSTKCSPSASAVSHLTSFFVHESSYIDDNVQIGEGTKIWHFSHILQNSVIGRECVIGQNVAIGPNVTIGNRCKIQNNVSIYKGVILEDEVFCGPSCVFSNVYNPRAFIDRKLEFKKTFVKKGATIGANATIVCGVTIGQYSMIGAGAVVKSDVPDYAVVVGVPAKQIGWACTCGVTLRFKENHAVCSYCGNIFDLEGEKIKRCLSE